MRARALALVAVAALGACTTACTTARVAAEHVVEHAPAWAWHPDSLVAHRDTTYRSARRRILVERFAPRDAGTRRLPAVLVLHPSDGVRGKGGAYVRQWADGLARRGYVAWVIHYFDRTGDRRTKDAYEDRIYPQWTAALEDAVTFVRADPQVDSTRVDAFGFSLGGYMALALGASDPRIRRLVVLSGGFFPTLARDVRFLPPTLLLHGDADRTVPLAEARRVERTLASLGVAHALVVYPGQGHGIARASIPDGVARAAAFLEAPDAATGAARAAAGNR